MLEKPDVTDNDLAAGVYQAFGVVPADLAFLPLGADQNTAVYRIVAGDDKVYFFKLRRGSFEPTSVTLPAWLHAEGIEQVIAPLPTRTGQYWTQLDDFTCILYPFVEGRDAYEVVPSDDQWREFGAALRRIHGAAIPAAIGGHIPRETWSPHWRQSVRTYVEGAAERTPVDAVAAEALAILKSERTVILDLVARTERLGTILQLQRLPYVVCHTDLHAGNLHIAPDGALYIVDWDNPLLAPKERDLMYPGAGLFGGARTPAEEEALFYTGYGATTVHRTALAYYRYERIVQDIAAYCDQLLLTGEGGEDRAPSLGYLASNFRPGSTIDIARAADRTGA